MYLDQRCKIIEKSGIANIHPNSHWHKNMLYSDPAEADIQ